MTTTESNKTSTPRGETVRKSWYDQLECSEDEMSTVCPEFNANFSPFSIHQLKIFDFCLVTKDSESISTEDDTTSCVSDSSEHCERMTIDDPDLDQLTSASEISEPINICRKRQTSVESYPSSSHSSDGASQSNATPFKRNQFERKLEKDAAILARREKQIQYGKNTASYKDYIRQTPKCVFFVCLLFVDLCCYENI